MKTYRIFYCVVFLVMARGLKAEKAADVLPKKPLSPAFDRKNWELIGAKVGWSTWEDGFRFYVHEAHIKNQILTFSFSQRFVSEVKATKIPSPDMAFGLVLSGNQVNRDVLENIKGFKNLEMLEINNSKISDEMVALLSEFKSLKTLSLANCDLIGEKSLSELAQLERLDLSETTVKAKQLIGLRNVRGLTKPLIKEISKATSLEELSLCGVLLSDDMAEKLGECMHLRRLNLYAALVTSEGLKSILKNKNLTYLNIGTHSIMNTSVSDTATVDIAALQGLSHLVLNGSSVSDQGIAEITKLKELRILGLRRTLITDRGLEILSFVPTIRDLDLTDTKVMDKGIKALCKIKSIRVLKLSGCLITDLCLEEVAGLSNLETLDLSKTNVSDEGIGSLFRLKKLREINLWSTRITDNGLDKLSKFSSLQKVILGGTGETLDGVNRLKMALPNVNVIR
jgi:internalin A